MYSIPTKEPATPEITIEDRVASLQTPSKNKLLLLIAGILILLLLGFFIVNSSGILRKSGEVAGVSSQNKKLFEELRAMPQYSKMYAELVRTKSYKKMEDGTYTIVVIDDNNLGNSALNIEEYILHNEFSNESKRLISLSDKQVQFTQDGFGNKKLNDRDILQEYKFPSGSIIEISRKY